MRALIALALAGFIPGCEPGPKEVDFRPLTPEAAAQRSYAYMACTATRDMSNKWDRQIAIRCMELRGYVHDPR